MKHIFSIERLKTAALLLAVCIVLSMVAPTLAFDEPAAPAEITAPTEEPATEPAPSEEPAVEPAPTEEPAAEPAPTEEPATEPALSEEPVAEPAPSEEPPATTASLTLAWVSGGTLDENGVYQVVGDQFWRNSQKHVIYHMEFALGGGKTAAPGEIEIRLPRYLFAKRDGTGLEMTQIPLPLAPATGGTTGFNYSLDGDEIVIKNFDQIEGSNVFQCDFQYTFKVYSYMGDIASGYTKELTATATLPTETEETLTVSSNTIKMEYTTEVGLSTRKKEYEAKYENWMAEWGEAPADAADWIYIKWKVTYYYENFYAQPFTLTLEDVPTHGGQTVGWYLPSNGHYQAGASLDVIHEHEASNNGYFCWVIVKYPRSQVPDKEIISNKVTFSLAGFDGDTASYEASAAYQYFAPKPFSAPAAVYSLEKYGRWADPPSQSALNRLERGMVIKDLTYDKIESTIQDYALTLEPGADPTVAESYGKVPYTAEVVDEYLWLQSERLVPGDYELTGFNLNQFTQYSYQLNEATQEYEVMETAEAEYDPAQVWIKTGSSNTWTLYGTAVSKGYGKGFTFTSEPGYENGGVYGYAQYVPLPANTTAYKLTVTTTKCKTWIITGVKLTLYPTEHVLALVADRSSTDDFGYLVNVASIMSEDSGGALHCGEEAEPYINYMVPSVVKQQVRPAFKDKQIADYGKAIWGYGNFLRLAKMWTSVSSSKGVDYVNDTAAGRVNANYRVNFRSLAPLGGNTMEEFKELAAIPEQRRGTFYDLLPMGMTAELSSIRVLTANNTDAEVTSVETVENWRGSGRTMLIVGCAMQDGVDNFYYHFTGEVYTGFSLWVTAWYPWDSIKDFGDEPRNSAAYVSGVGAYPKGLADTGGTIIDAALLADLDDDGNPEGTPNNMTYMQLTQKLNLVTASEMSFAKGVKTQEQGSYTTGRGETEVTVMGGGSYSYRLRLGTKPNQRAQGLVFYDVLEQHDPTTLTNRWSGTLESIDISQPKAKGIDVQVYYSTQAVALPDDSALDNGKWSLLTDTTDLSTVKALAFDMSKDTGGNDYVVQPDQSVSVYLYMRAPMENVKALAASGACAYNTAWWKASVTLGDGSPVESTLRADYTKVGIKEPELDIHKAAAPASGTEEEPTAVRPDETLTYNVTIQNTGSGTTINNIVVEDAIPAGLTIDAANIKAYFGSYASAAKPVGELGRLACTVTGNSLSLTISSLGGQEKLTLLIPTAMTGTEERFVNTAKITSVEGFDWVKSSETTYHKRLEPAQLRLKKVVSNYTDSLAGDEFILKLTGGATAGAVLGHNDTTGYMSVELTDATQFSVSEIVPMEYSAAYTVSITVESGSEGTAPTLSGKTVTLYPGNKVTLVVTNTFGHKGYFKGFASAHNKFAANTVS